MALFIADKDTLDSVNAKIGSVGSSETLAQDLRDLLAKADATISSRAPSSTALSNATWTNTKAGYLDAAISSRAPSSTALSTAQWTNTRAGYLDYLANATYGLSAIKTEVTNTKTEATTAKTNAANAKSVADTINASLGAAANTGGNYAAGTVHAKLSTLILNSTGITFTAGTTFNIYNPITASTVLTAGTSAGSYYDTNGSSLSLYSLTQNTYKYTAKNSGTMRLTIVGSTSAATTVYFYVSTTNSAFPTYNKTFGSGCTSYPRAVHQGTAKSLTTTSSTQTYDFNVTAGSTYYINLRATTRSVKYTITNLKLSAGISARLVP